jgi:hypothetical protein
VYIAAFCTERYEEHTEGRRLVGKQVLYRTMGKIRRREEIE